MTFRVQNFVQEVSSRGLARQNRFQVEISSVDFWPGGDGRILTLLCQSASLPGATIAVKKQALFGPEYVRPGNINYGDTLQLSFLCDKDMWVRTVFDLWMHRVVNNSEFTVNFKNQYVRDILIKQLDENENTTYAIKLIDAFPVQMGALALNQSALDRFHMLPVTFSYRYWETENISNSSVFEPLVDGPKEGLKRWGPEIPDNRPKPSTEDSDIYGLNPIYERAGEPQ